MALDRNPSSVAMTMTMMTMMKRPVILAKQAIVIVITLPLFYVTHKHVHDITIYACTYPQDVKICM